MKVLKSRYQQAARHFQSGQHLRWSSVESVEGCRLGTQNDEVYLGRTANDQVGNIYVGRTLNVSRDVGSELKMANFTLVEQRMTKVKSPF